MTKSYNAKCAVGIVLLVLLTFIALSYLEAGNVIRISSKGKAWAKSANGVITYGCDNSDNVDCTITINTCPEN